MNCRRVNQSLSAYMDGELLGVEHLQVHAHIRECSCCRAEYESLLGIKRMLGGMRVQRPREDLAMNISCKLTETRSVRGQWLAHTEFLRRPRWSVVGGAAVLAALLGAFVNTPASAPVPEPAQTGQMLAGGVPAIADSAVPPSPYGAGLSPVGLGQTGQSARRRPTPVPLFTLDPGLPQNMFVPR